MSDSPAEPFPIEWDETKVPTETIKWTLGANGQIKHEIVSPMLAKSELGKLVHHCLAVMHKIDTHVGAANAANRFASYMQVFPRTLSIQLLATWDNILVDHPLAAQDVASFHQAIRHFIEAHATDDDRHELLEYIRSVSKPRSMDVQTYFSRLRELNDQVHWLPGNDLPLTDIQLNQAFHDGMPTAWKERYENAGRSVRHDARAEILRFFRKQQKAAERSQKRNEKEQRIASQSRYPSVHDRAAHHFINKDKHYKRESKDDAKHRSKKSKNISKTAGRIADDAKCPVHPNGNHTWGECF
jgi:hypothetical protein